MKSQMWKHFEISDGDSSLVICEICNTRISRGSLKCSTSYNYTSNMLKHILSKHREVSLAQESIPCTSKTTAQASLLHKQVYCIALQKQKVYDINDPCAKAISKHNYGDNDCQGSAAFLDCRRCCIKHIVPQYNIPSRRYFVDNVIGELYHDTRAKLVSSISSVKQLSLTPDIWSSRINDRYIGVTAYYININ